MSADRRRGWCPGALRPMRTGDGLLVRVRITGGVLDADLARELARAAHAFGNGLLDLSARANLQLRGVSDATLGPLQARLAALGLLDADPAAETVRNVLASPLAGLDPSAVMDAGPLAQALEAALREATHLHELPAKFLFLIDGCGALPLAGIGADLRFVAIDAERLRVELAGTAVGVVAVGEVVPVALALAEAFLALRRGDERRVRDVVARLGPAAFTARVPTLCDGAEAAARAAIRPIVALAGFVPWSAQEIAETQSDESRRQPLSSPLRGGVGGGGRAEMGSPDVCDPHLESLPARGRAATGVAAATTHAERLPYDSPGFVAAAAPFGRLTSHQLDGLAELAAAHHAGLRLTPWRAIAIAPVAADRAADLLAAVAALGLVVDPADPRLAVAACPGAPACASGQAETQRDAVLFAETLAPKLRPGLSVHVSGCAKGCARAAPASLMLVADGGRYRLAFDATAATPAHTPLLTPQAMAAHLAALHLDGPASESPASHA